MFFRFSSVALVALLSVSGVQAASAKTDTWSQYQQLAQQAYQTAKKAPLSQLKQQGEKLVEQAQVMLPQFIQTNPQCKIYLNAALAAKDAMLASDLVAMERDYHGDAKLPQLTDGSCYHAKDLLVHAASVVVLVNEKMPEVKKRAQIEHELDEVLEHFELVKQSLKK